MGKVVKPAGRDKDSAQAGRGMIGGCLTRTVHELRGLHSRVHLLN